MFEGMITLKREELGWQTEARSVLPDWLKQIAWTHRKQGEACLEISVES